MKKILARRVLGHKAWVLKGSDFNKFWKCNKLYGLGVMTLPLFSNHGKFVHVPEDFTDIVCVYDWSAEPDFPYIITDEDRIMLNQLWNDFYVM